MGACAVSFKDSIGVWTKICSTIHKPAYSKSTSLKIATCNLNLIKNKAVRCDLELIAVFHKWFLFPYFKFLQECDPFAGNTASFLAIHITVRYFLMLEDLKVIQNEGYKSDVNFSDYISSFSALTIDEQTIATKNSLTSSVISKSHL